MMYTYTNQFNPNRLTTEQFRAKCYYDHALGTPICDILVAHEMEALVLSRGFNFSDLARVFVPRKAGAPLTHRG